jgi:predicted  nucleic acid-binding Zn-ribbon protein
MSKLYKYLVALGAFVTAILYGLLTRSRLKRTEDKLDQAEAESESLNRQSELLRERHIETQKAIDEARQSDATVSDINDILRKHKAR